MTAMKAVQIQQLRTPMSIEQLPVPDVGDDEVLVRLTASGICRTDWHVYNGDWTWADLELPLPMVLGHEIAGVIERVGARRHLAQRRHAGVRTVQLRRRTMRRVPVRKTEPVRERVLAVHGDRLRRVRPIRQGPQRPTELHPAARQRLRQGRRRLGMPVHDRLPRSAHPVAASGRGDHRRRRRRRRRTLGRPDRRRQRRAWSSPSTRRTAHCRRPPSSVPHTP